MDISIALWIALWIAIGVAAFFMAIGTIYTTLCFCYALTPIGRKNADPMDDLYDFMDRMGWRLPWWPETATWSEPPVRRYVRPAPLVDKPSCGCVAYPTYGLDAALEGNIIVGFHVEPCDQHTELDLAPYIEDQARQSHWPGQTTPQVPGCEGQFHACPGENCTTARKFVQRIRAGETDVH